MARVGLLQSNAGDVNAAGDLTITVVCPDIRWQVTQVSIEMQSAPAGAQCELRHNGRFITSLIATGDAAGGDPPLPMRPGDSFTVQWTSCTPGDQGRVTWFYDELKWDA